MSLSEGTRLGSYEVTGLIGAGGMGEVYRATDTKLGRDVAIKTLPAALASDKDRLARFEREAKLLAALNHPYIASIYSLDEHEGTLYLAMELIEGETLEEKLKPGALQVEESLQLALQIAEALEAAHEKGVVHRDLKPANVMITADGIVKVLDFGLAKVFSAGSSNESNVAQSPALSVAMTQQGLILGTAGYMSPEQASGQPTDQRADIWAFGVVLYEMLTGLPLFSGESVPHILADVLKTEPDWNKLPRDLHPRTRLMLERCLAKKPRNRYHSIADVRVDIQAALADPTGAAIRIESTAIFPARRFVAGLAAAVFVTATVAGLITWGSWPEPEVKRVTRFTLDVPSGSLSPRFRAFMLSPDGQQILYQMDDGLYLRALDELEWRTIPLVESEASAMFVPSGEAFVLRRRTPVLERMPITGGPATPWSDMTALEQSRVGHWTSDGRLLVTHRGGVSEIPWPAGGPPKSILDLDDDVLPIGAQLLPDGDTMLLVKANPTLQIGAGNAPIVAVRLSDGEELGEIVPRGQDPRYLAETGHLLYTLDGTVYAVAFDADSLETSGPHEPVLPTSASGITEYDVAADGTLIYISGSDASRPVENAGFFWIAADGSLEELPFDSETARHLRLSPDGTRLAVAAAVDGGNYEIYVYDLERVGARTRVTLHDANDIRPMWTPDGESIIFYSSRDGGGLYRAAANRPGSAVRIVDLLDGYNSLLPLWFDQDNSELGFAANSSQLFEGIWRVSLADDGEPEPVKDLPNVDESFAALSPNGDWLAFDSNQEGEFEVYLSPYPDVESGEIPVSIGGGREPVWDKDGDTLYYVDDQSRRLMSVDIQFSPLELGEPRVVSDQLIVASRAQRPSFDFDAVNERFIVLAMPDESFDVNPGEQQEEISIVVVLNWFEELKRLVPTD